MGTWSAGLYGNDVAQDLRIEYTCVFWRYDAEEGLERLDRYVRENICDESDEEEWSSYFYSLADFMWKKGILTDDVRCRAVKMIDSGFGLDVWRESGKSALRQREKVLAKLREQLLSPQPARKRIKPDVNIEQIFNDGDIIAVQLQTAGKPFTKSNIRTMSAGEFRDCDGKYVLMQKVKCYASWQSAVVPEIGDYWAVFRLFDGVYDEPPESVDISQLKNAEFCRYGWRSPLFCCESNMYYFKKRKYRVVGSFPEAVPQAGKNTDHFLFFGVDNQNSNPDSELLAAMGHEIRFGKYSGELQPLLDMALQANMARSRNYKFTEQEHREMLRREEREITERLERSYLTGAEFYTVVSSKFCGFASVESGLIKNLYIDGDFQLLGLGTALLRHIQEVSVKISMVIPEVRKREILEHICKKLSVDAIME